jgi:hypothetical protein
MTDIQPIVPVVHYQFGCNQDGQALVIDLGPLMDDLKRLLGDGHLCDVASNGLVSQTVLQSNARIQELQQVSEHVEAFALEVWFTMLDEIQTSSPLLAFAGPDYSGQLDDGCGGYQVALAYRQGQIELRYIEESDFGDNCRILVVPELDWVPLQLYQVVALWTNGQTSVYVDGIPFVLGAPNQFDPTLSHWDPDLTLQLFGQGVPASLSMFSIYNQMLSDADALDLYQKGLLLLTPTNRDPLHLNILEARSIHTSPQGEPTSLRLIPGYQIGSGETPVPNDWSLMVEVTTLPLYGSLFYSVGQDSEALLVHINERIPLADIESIAYHPGSLEFFNSPSFSYNGTSLDPKQETFSYRLIALSGDESSSQLLASSDIATLELIVIHVNHASTLQAPKEAVVPENQTTGVGARPLAYVEGIRLLDDLDFDIDRVRVDIWAYNGTLKLAHPELADFANCRANERQALLGKITWSCFGDGRGNRNMTFVATPDNVSTILSTVEYNGFSWDQDDTIVIRIFDGEGGQCLTQEEHRRVQYDGDSYHTVHNDECFQSMATILVPAMHLEEFKGSYVRAFFDDLDHFGAPDAIFWGIVVLFLVTSCASIRTCIRCFGARGAKIEIRGSIPTDASV